MQLKQFSVKGLFGSHNHTIPFAVPEDEDARPSVVIVHGRNGVGKTTALRMLDGLIRLDFNLFRTIPFSSCSLSFTIGPAISVRSVKKKTLEALEVTFGKTVVKLNPEHSGPLTEKDWPSVESFREKFFAATKAVTFEFIDTERLSQLQKPDDSSEEAIRVIVTPDGRRVERRPLHNPKARQVRLEPSLSSRVARFIREAQVNYRTFFSTTEPDLFPRIIERLTSKEKQVFAPANLRSRLTKIRDQDEKTERFGLEPDHWDYSQLIAQLSLLAKGRGVAREQALTVLGSYVELLESRAAERALVADRLLTFEYLISEFMTGKEIRVNTESGLEIVTKNGEQLRENQLSSGEYHLLFLMVAALVTKRRGTVIAIDEPEMSMHIAWQRKLIPALVKCASGAEPLFIFATHSPDIAASLPDAMIELH